MAFRPFARKEPTQNPRRANEVPLKAHSEDGLPDQPSADESKAITSAVDVQPTPATTIDTNTARGKWEALSFDKKEAFIGLIQERTELAKKRENLGWLAKKILGREKQIHSRLRDIDTELKTQHGDVLHLHNALIDEEGLYDATDHVSFSAMDIDPELIRRLTDELISENTEVRAGAPYEGEVPGVNEKVDMIEVEEGDYVIVKDAMGQTRLGKVHETFQNNRMDLVDPKIPPKTDDPDANIIVRKIVIDENGREQKILDFDEKDIIRKATPEEIDKKNEEQELQAYPKAKQENPFNQTEEDFFNETAAKEYAKMDPRQALELARQKMSPEARQAIEQIEERTTDTASQFLPETRARYMREITTRNERIQKGVLGLAALGILVGTLAIMGKTVEPRLLAKYAENLPVASETIVVEAERAPQEINFAESATFETPIIKGQAAHAEKNVEAAPRIDQYPGFNTPTLKTIGRYLESHKEKFAHRLTTPELSLQFAQKIETLLETNDPNDTDALSKATVRASLQIGMKI